MIFEALWIHLESVGANVCEAKNMAKILSTYPTNGFSFVLIIWKNRAKVK